MFRRKAPENEHLKLRQRHIDEFLRLNSTARAVNADKSCYEVPIYSPNGKLSLQVNFPPQFPEKPPLVQLLSPYSASRPSHAYLDHDNFLSYHPQLAQSGWSPHANLGSIVQEIVQNWSTNPPFPPVASPNPFLSQSNPAAVSASSQPAQPNSAAFQSPPQLQSTPSSGASVSSLVQIPPQFPELDGLSIAELEILDSDPQALQDFLYSLESIQLSNVMKMKVELHESLKDMATTALDKQKELESLKQSISELERSAVEKQKELMELNGRQLQYLSRYSIGNVVKEMEKAVEKEENESELVRESYEQSNGSSESVEEKESGKRHMKFVEQYGKARQCVHEMAGKKEILVEKYGRRT